MKLKKGKNSVSPLKKQIGVKNHVLVIYDITDNKKRRNIVDILKGYGVRVQKSSFEMDLGNYKYKEMVRILKTFGTDGDSVNVYNLGRVYNVERFGSDIKSEKKTIII